MFYKTIIEVAPAVMREELTARFHLNSFEFGLIGSAYFFAYFLFQVPAALMLDRAQQRLTLSGAILLCAIGSLLFSVANSFMGAFVGRFIAGIGASFAFVNCLRLVSNWFKPKQIGIVAGVMLTFGMLGAFVGIAPLSAWINDWGWQSALDLFSMVGIFMAAIFWICVRDGKPMKKTRQLLPMTQFKKVANMRRSWSLSFYSALAFTPVGVFGAFWGVPYLRVAHSLSEPAAAWCISLFFLGFALAAPMLGWFSDQIHSRRKVALWGTLASLVTLCLVLFIPNMNGAILGGLLFLCGGVTASYLVAFAMIREIHKPQLATVATGFMAALNGLIIALYNPAAGLWMDTTLYRLGFCALPISQVIALLILYFSRDTKKQKTTIPEALP